MTTLANLKKAKEEQYQKSMLQVPCRRIIEMGLTVGTKVTVMGVAPMGDPMGYPSKATA